MDGPVDEQDRPDLYDEADPEVWSNTSIGVRLTWRELAEHQQGRIRRLSSLAALLGDLDRCEHGRHEHDVCSGCGGPSLGNPFVGAQDGRAAYEVVPRQVGFDISGRPIVMPEGRDKSDADAWASGTGGGP